MCSLWVVRKEKLMEKCSDFVSAYPRIVPRLVLRDNSGDDFLMRLLLPFAWQDNGPCLRPAQRRLESI
ncbi:GM22372 [Drosophila sechellia]|uniref:GM22372 n=1 Tax=Drosophila sechellia TaxID=7238 RepID=B4IAQ0_DROSE|nr:GM22372 [Drosophila sechellia]